MSSFHTSPGMPYPHVPVPTTGIMRPSLAAFISFTLGKSAALDSAINSGKTKRDAAIRPTIQYTNCVSTRAGWAGLVGLLAALACRMMVIICVALALLQIISAAEVPTVKLSNAAKPGTNMPAVGIGTGGYMYAPTAPGEIWTDDVAETAVSTWFKIGRRRVDASFSYRNQNGVGKAIAASQIPREEMFIVSKVGSGGLIQSGYAMGYNDTLIQIKPILDTLQVDYVDLLLVHWPGPPGNSTDPLCQGDPPTFRGSRQSTWRAMEELYYTGKARAIGVSNFEKFHLEEILDLGGLIPAVNQAEFHPYWHEDDLVAFCKANNIVYNGYSPLGCPDWTIIGLIIICCKNRQYCRLLKLISAPSTGSAAVGMATRSHC